MRADRCRQGSVRASAALFLLAALSLSCGGEPPGRQDEAARDDRPLPTSGAQGLTITSPAFADGGEIPVRHTCDGENLSPPLAWSGVPGSARSLALVCDDPDAPGGTWVHWVLYGLPPSARGLPEGLPRTRTVQPGEARHGLNSFEQLGYGGPCPPPGAPHRYVFKLYALDAPLRLEERPSAVALERAMRGHVLAEARLTGTYARRGGR